MGPVVAMGRGWGKGRGSTVASLAVPLHFLQRARGGKNRASFQRNLLLLGDPLAVGQAGDHIEGHLAHLSWKRKLPRSIF
jgi:hypothetical protein